MDLNVGKHCSVVSCNVKDLLPIQCSQCKSHFCREHFGIDCHDCSGASTDTSPPDELWVKRETCHFGGCNKPTLASAFDASGSKSDTAQRDTLCSQCSEAFCVTHRYPDAHECKGTTHITSDVPVSGSRASQVEAAKALLAKNYPKTSKTKGSTSASATPTSSSILKSKPPKDPIKLAKFKAVELMKMRHKASPGDPKDKNIAVGLDRRVHLFVSNEAGGAEGGQPVLLWFRKDLICGRILDMLDIRFGLTKTPTRLCIIGDDDSEGDAELDKAIGEHVSDGGKLIVRTRE